MARRKVVTTVRGRAYFAPTGQNVMLDVMYFDGFDDVQCEDVYDENAEYRGFGHISNEDGIEFNGQDPLEMFL